MEWNRNKPAYNRASIDQVEEVCLQRNHTLLKYEFPNVVVKCHCGTVFTKTFRLYKPQKNGCPECDRLRKFIKRPSHSALMREKSSILELNKLTQESLKRGFPPEVIAFMYEQKLTIKEISFLLGCSAHWVKKSLKMKGTKVRIKNDYGNPTDSVAVREKIARNCKSRGSGGWDIKEEERLLPGVLYFIRYLDESGTHFKIGITKRPLSERFNKGQLISIIYIRHATLGECFDLEQSVLKWARASGYRYSSPSTTELIRPEAYSEVLQLLAEV